MFTTSVTAAVYPQLVENYRTYCRYRKMAEQTGKLDLSHISFLYPTTLLPLLILMQKIDAKYITPPRDRDIAN